MIKNNDQEKYAWIILKRTGNGENPVYNFKQNAACEFQVKKWGMPQLD